MPPRAADPHLKAGLFARPASRDVLTQKTECSPQLARLTAGHICMRGDYVRRPDLPVIPTKAMIPLGDLQTVYGVDRARLLPAASAREARNHRLMAVAVRVSAA